MRGVTCQPRHKGETFAYRFDGTFEMAREVAARLGVGFGIECDASGRITGFDFGPVEPDNPVEIGDWIVISDDGSLLGIHDEEEFRRLYVVDAQPLRVVDAEG